MESTKGSLKKVPGFRDVQAELRKYSLRATSTLLSTYLGRCWDDATSMRSMASILRSGQATLMMKRSGINCFVTSKFDST